MIECQLRGKHGGRETGEGVQQNAAQEDREGGGH
jgi:hypothetical protein